MDKILETLKKIFMKQEGATDDKWKEMEAELKSTLQSTGEMVTLPADMDAQTRAVIQSLMDQNRGLMTMVKDLQNTIAKEQSEREKAMAAAAEKAKAEREKKISDAVEKLFTEKKITEAQKAHWKKLFDADFETAEKLAADLKEIGGTQRNFQTSGNQVINGFQSMGGNASILRAIQDMAAKGRNETEN